MALGPIPPLPLMPFMSQGPLSTGPMPAASPPASASGAQSPGGFAELLGDAMGSLNTQMQEASALQQAVATGQVSDPTEAITATAESGLAFQFATQVRNRLVEGWQEISRMQV